MKPLQIFRTKHKHMHGCWPLSKSERMARYSERYAEEMRLRENAAAAAPKVRMLDGRTVLVALAGRVNSIPKDK
jgi:hypothetical protein